jgi:S-formylglutathione hydrolase FrmB
VVCAALVALFAAGCGAGTKDTAAPSPMATTGAVSTVTIPATESGFPAREARLYLPPGYRPGQAARLPVLVMLAGVPGGTGDWFDNADLQQALDTFAAQHGGRAPIVVAPDDTGASDEDLLCMDSPEAKVDTYLSQDVPNWIHHQLAADPDTRTWAVGGLSYGGTCAYQLAVRHPALFPTFLDFSGEKHPMLDTVTNAVDTLFNGDSAAYRRQDPLTILATRRFPHSAGMIAVGSDDEPYTSEQHVVLTACRNAGMQVDWLELAGGHEWSVWAEFFRRSLPWLTRRMGLDQTPR